VCGESSTASALHSRISFFLFGAGVGRTGWHIDGSFQPAPFAYSLYHMVKVPKTVRLPRQAQLIILAPGKPQMLACGGAHAEISTPSVPAAAVPAHLADAPNVSSTHTELWPLGLDGFSVRSRAVLAIAQQGPLRGFQRRARRRGAEWLHVTCWWVLQGDTVFAPLTEIVHSLPPEQRQRWERLSMCSDRRGMLVHPLIYSHPVTGEDTLCFHLGAWGRVGWCWWEGGFSVANRL
jgi:hypothetical protein